VRQLARFFTLHRSQQIALAEAVLSLGVARLFLLLPFRWLVRLIGRPRAVTDRPNRMLESNERFAASAVRSAILRTSGRLPWPSNCLVRAWAARMMLRRRGLRSALHLGVRGGSATELSAHAWLTCGDIDVVGVEDATEFTPIAEFHG
jgi:hypothetical protein